jgi:hypothetical protein
MVLSFVKTELFKKEGTTWILCIFRLQSCIVEWSCSLACVQSVLQMAIKWSGTYYRRLLVKLTWNNSMWCWGNLFGSYDNNFVIQKVTLAAQSKYKKTKNPLDADAAPISQRVLRCLQVCRLRPLVVLITVVTWWWILSPGGVIITGQDWKTRRKPLLSAPSSTNMHRSGIELTPSLSAISD